MKNKVKALLLVGATVGITSSLTAAHVNFLSPDASTGYSGVTSDGTSLTDFAAGTWTFQLGMFSGDPTTTDISDWGADFSSFNETSWVVSPSFAAGKIDATSFLEDGSSFTGNQAYVWAFNSKDIESTSEWMVATDDSWTFPDHDPLSTGPSPDATYNLADATSFAIGSGDSDGFQTEAIPEPSTYALIFGLGILGFLGFRRFRK